MSDVKQNHFHAMHAEQVCALLGVQPEEGLSTEEVLQRQLRDGKNVLPRAPQMTVMQVIFQQFLSPLMGVIIASAVTSFAIGHVADALFIGVVVLLNAVLGAIQ